MDFTGSGGERRLSLLPRAPPPALVRSPVFSLAWRCALSPALLCHPNGEDHAARLRAGLEPLRLGIGVGDDAAPTWMEARPPWQTTVRMVMHESRVPE